MAMNYCFYVLQRYKLPNATLQVHVSVRPSSFNSLRSDSAAVARQQLRSDVHMQAAESQLN